MQARKRMTTMLEAMMAMSTQEKAEEPASQMPGILAVTEVMTGDSASVKVSCSQVLLVWH